MSVTVKGTRYASPSVFTGFVRHTHSSTEAERVERRKIPYWRERGWTRQGHVYSGAYRTKYGSFPGTVEERRFEDLRFYLIGPPQAIRQR